MNRCRVRITSSSCKLCPTGGTLVSSTTEDTGLHIPALHVHPRLANSATEKPFYCHSTTCLLAGVLNSAASPFPCGYRAEATEQGGAIGTKSRACTQRALSKGTRPIRTIPGMKALFTSSQKTLRSGGKKIMI